LRLINSKASHFWWHSKIAQKNTFPSPQMWECELLIAVQYFKNKKILFLFLIPIFAWCLHFRNYYLPPLVYLTLAFMLYLFKVSVVSAKRVTMKMIHFNDSFSLWGKEFLSRKQLLWKFWGKYREFFWLNCSKIFYLNFQITFLKMKRLWKWNMVGQIMLNHVENETPEL
jgi:hypothetical protein